MSGGEGTGSGVDSGGSGVKSGAGVSAGSIIAPGGGVPSTPWLGRWLLSLLSSEEDFSSSFSCRDEEEGFLLALGLAFGL